jgi:hypothetical protein
VFGETARETESGRGEDGRSNTWFDARHALADALHNTASLVAENAREETCMKNHTGENETGTERVRGREREGTGQTESV